MTKIKFWRAVFSLLALGTGLFFFFHVWNVLIPFILGVTIAYLIHPLVDRFVALGLRRDRTVIVLYAFLLGLVVMLGFLIIPPLLHEANSALSDLPAYAARLNALNDRWGAELSQLFQRYMGKKAHPIVLPFRVDHLLEGWVTELPGNILGFANAGLWIFIIPFVCFFALAQGKQWLDNLFDWTPSEYVENLLGLIAEVNATLGGYVRGQLLDSMCVGLLTMFGLWILGFNQAVLMGVLAAFLNPVPFLAPLVIGGLSFLLAYMQGMSGTALFGIFCLFVLVRLCDDFFFTPFIVGQSVRLHPLLMLFAILAGVEMGGFLGLVFAVPVAAIIKVVLSIMLRSRRERIVFENHHIVS